MKELRGDEELRRALAEELLPEAAREDSVHAAWFSVVACGLCAVGFLP